MEPALQLAPTQLHHITILMQLQKVVLQYVQIITSEMII